MVFKNRKRRKIGEKKRKIGEKKRTMVKRELFFIK